jgi:hypothetical protein
MHKSLEPWRYEPGKLVDSELLRRIVNHSRVTVLCQRWEKNGLPAMSQACPYNIELHCGLQHHILMSQSCHHLVEVKMNDQCDQLGSCEKTGFYRKTIPVPGDQDRPCHQK